MTAHRKSYLCSQKLCKSFLEIEVDINGTIESSGSTRTTPILVQSGLGSILQVPQLPQSEEIARCKVQHIFFNSANFYVITKNFLDDLQKRTHNNVSKALFKC